MCCKDKKHCCPNGYTCDTGSGKCTKGDISLPWFEKLPSVEVKKEFITCPDGTSSCGAKQTCCLLASGSYGCCPQPKVSD